MLLGIQKRALKQSLETQSLAVSPQNRGSPLGTENIFQCRAFLGTGAHFKAQGPLYRRSSLCGGGGGWEPSSMLDIIHLSWHLPIGPVPKKGPSQNRDSLGFRAMGPLHCRGLLSSKGKSSISRLFTYVPLGTWASYGLFRNGFVTRCLKLASVSGWPLGQEEPRKVLHIYTGIRPSNPQLSTHHTA